MPHQLRPVAAAAALALLASGSWAQQQDSAATPTLSTVTVRASADASAQGLSPAFPGGQVARGGRAGILGTQDNMETPFSITSYTNEYILDRQASSVGAVLRSDPFVGVARGFGNFQEAYFIRGFVVTSDDTAYNGLYSLMPRQYIATELFERVEVLRGATAFLTGATPSGNGLGGAINLLPKRAPNEPLNRVSVETGSGGYGHVSADIARRFGPDGSTGIRVNAGYRDGGTGVDSEKQKTTVASVGLDWHNRDVRLSGDIGWQENQFKQTRPSVTPAGATSIPAPNASVNFAQPWTYSNEKDLFGTLRGEWDINSAVTAWAAYGGRRGDESNRLAGFNLTNGSTGDGYTYRYDNVREDQVDTGELGLRGKLRTGSVGHEWVVAASRFKSTEKNAYKMDFFNQQATNLFNPVYSALPAFSGAEFAGGNLAAPGVTNRINLTSYALGDTLSLVNDTVLLTLGARHQQMHTTAYDFNTGAVNANGDYDKSRTSPALGAVWKVNKQFSAYANYIEGLTKGDVAPPGTTNANAVFAPYVTKQQEVGLKYDAGRLGAGLALFSIERPRSTGGGVGQTFTQSGKDRHQGVELSVFGEATRGLRLLGGVTWLDAKQVSTGDATTEGKRVIGVPKMQGSIGAEWDVPGVDRLALDARLTAGGSRYADAANTLKVGGWGRVDVGARYLMEVGGRLVTLRARIDNLADRSYWASTGGYPGQGYMVVGAPRTFSLGASIDF
ncbi:TonB-dependent receptor [Ramlibacter sp. G-1-2-2]|uniref:TonB-dependent receptor n=1 Tax=Ramlibacter agri TaxID=2728837 RepID=A0A848HCL3_9BURK|nr:TonB-dependent receptor [Ramlibacter agri]NML48475.1 TonB-dependent receptor [Ramlibacter agri]